MTYEWTRDKHLASAKQEAFARLDQGLVASGMAGFMTALLNHPDTAELVTTEVWHAAMDLALADIRRGDWSHSQAWIEGFD